MVKVIVFVLTSQRINLMSFLHIDMAQAIEIIPWVRQGPTYST